MTHPFAVLCRTGNLSRTIAASLIVIFLAQSELMAQPAISRSGDEKCVIVEVYISESTPASKDALAAATRLAESRRGVRLVVRSIDQSEKARERLRRIAAYFHFDERTTPVVYACNRVISKGIDANDFHRQLAEALTMEVFTRRGCKRCERAKAYLPLISHSYPGIQIVYREILGYPDNQRSLNELVRRHRKAASSTPVIHVCNQLIIGFDRPETTGARIRQTLDRWMAACPGPNDTSTHSNPSQSSAREVAAHNPF